MHPGNADDEAQSRAVQQAMQQEHETYRAHCSALRDGKRQVKMLRAVLERNRAELQQRFQAWRLQLQAAASREDHGMPSSHQQTRCVQHAPFDVHGKQRAHHNSSSTSSALLGTASGASWESIETVQGAQPGPLASAGPSLEGLPSDLQEQVQLLLTGDPDIDRDIVRFYRARHAMDASQHV